jgi:dTDP-4-amino-4,6-dideoxygalactose transaminase
MGVRRNFLPFASPEVGQAELDEIAKVLASGWITTGPRAREFESRFRTHVGAAHAIAVNSGTAALHLALEAVGLRRGDIVLTTPYGFAASAEVVRHFDALPVFVDVDPTTLNIDTRRLAEAAEALVTGDPHVMAPWLPPSLRGSGFGVRGSGTALGRVHAVLPVHIAGLPCELDAIYAVAVKHGLAVVEDAAHAFPTTYKGRAVGSRVTSYESRVSALKCFSFYATKTLATGEGGMITTEDEALADRCRIMALHGISKDAWKRYTAEGSWYYEIVAAGYKYNMGDVTAAMGLAQLGKVERMWERREEIARRYNEAFGGVEELQIPADREDCRHSWHLYMLRLNLEMLTIDRARFIEELKGRNVGTSVHFIPLHIHPYYRETYGYRPEDFPVARGEYLREISLPIYSKMTDGDVQNVVQSVMRVVTKHRR